MAHGKKISTVAALSALLILFGAIFVLPQGALAAASAPPYVPPPASDYNPADAEPSCSLFRPGSYPTCISYFVYILLFIIYGAVGFFITFAASVIQLLIDMGRGLIGNNLVSSGFRITLGIANLGFVLAIILIAFATILRIERYALKQTLWKLIVAAVLINFSLAIAGVILDFTNVLAYFFIDNANPAGRVGSFAAEMANSMNIQNLIEVSVDPNNPTAAAPLIAGALKFGGALLGIVASLLLALVFGAIIAIVFWGIASMLVIRYIYLSFLLILMPLAWLFWVIPDLSHLSRNWWNKFLQWTFFLPAVTFFLYLGILTAGSFDAVVAHSQQTNSGSSPGLALAGVIITTGGVETFLQVLVKIGIFAGALVAANAMGIKGSQGAMGAAMGVKNMALGFVGKGVRGGARAIGERPGRAMLRQTSKALGGIKKVPGLGRLVPQRAVNALAGLGSRKEDVERLQKELYANLTNDQLKKTAKSPLPLGPASKAALLKELSKRKLIGEVTKDMDEKTKDEFLVSLSSAAKQTNPGTKPSDIEAIKDILAINPSMAAKLTGKKNKDGSWTDEEGKSKVKLPDGTERAQKDTDIIAKFVPKVPSGEAHKLATRELENIDVVANLTRSQITNIYRNAPEDKVMAAKKTLNKALPFEIQGLSEDIADSREKVRQAKENNDPRLVNFESVLRGRIADKEKLYNQLRNEEKKAYDRLEFLTQKIGVEPF